MVCSYTCFCQTSLSCCIRKVRFSLQAHASSSWIFQIIKQPRFAGLSPSRLHLSNISFWGTFKHDDVILGDKQWQIFAWSVVLCVEFCMLMGCRSLWIKRPATCDAPKQSSRAGEPPPVSPSGFWGRSIGQSADQMTELFNGKLERAVLCLSAFHLLPPSAYLGAHPLWCPSYRNICKHPHYLYKVSWLDVGALIIRHFTRGL